MPDLSSLTKSIIVGMYKDAITKLEAELADAKEKLELAERAAKCNADDAGQLMERALAAEKQRDEFAAALEQIRLRHEASRLHRESEWLNDLSESINEAVYVRDPSAILARIRREAKAAGLEMWANWLQSGAVSAEQSIPGAMRSYAAALRRGEKGLTE